MNYDKTELQTVQPFSLKQNKTQVYDEFLQNFLLQTRNETDPSCAQIPRQSSSVGQIIFHLVSLNRFYQKSPRNGSVSHKQIGLNLLTVIFRSVLDQISSVGNPEN